MVRDGLHELAQQVGVEPALLGRHRHVGQVPVDLAASGHLVTIAEAGALGSQTTEEVFVLAVGDLAASVTAADHRHTGSTVTLMTQWCESGPIRQ